MLKDKWLTQGFVPSVHIVQGVENLKSVPERKKLTSNRLLPLLDKTDKRSKTPDPIPPTLVEQLLVCGYHLPTWTPAGCRDFLSQLRVEWSDFHVKGWHGCEFPDSWPVALMDAVTSIYVESLQDHGGEA